MRIILGQQVATDNALISIDEICMLQKTRRSNIAGRDFSM